MTENGCLMRGHMEGSKKKDNVNYKDMYKSYKRRLRLLVYEQEYFKSILEKNEQKLLILRRDKSFVLDQLLQYEQVTLSDNESSEELSEGDFQPVVSNFPIAQRPPVSPSTSTAATVVDRRKGQASSSGKVPKLATISKRGPRGKFSASLNSAEGLKKIGTKRATAGTAKTLAKKEKPKPSKPAGKPKGLQVKTVSITNQKPIEKPFEDKDEEDEEEEEEEDDDQLVISLPRPAAPTVSTNPGPIPDLPPSQFFDTSSSSSSNVGSSSSGSGDSSGSEEEEDNSDFEHNTPKNNGSTDGTHVVKCSSIVHPHGDHAYGAPPTHNSRLPGEHNNIIVNDSKLNDVKNDTNRLKQNSITAKPTPQRPSVLVSTMKGYNLGTIPSAASQLSLSPTLNSNSTFLKWSNRPDYSPSSGQDSAIASPNVGFTPIVGGSNSVGIVGEEQLSPNLSKSTSLMSPKGSAFHVVNQPLLSPAPTPQSTITNATGNS